MTEHLPECIFKPENIDSAKGIRWGGRPCICDELRACEQRVREEDQRSLIKYGVQMFMRGKQYGRPMAYAAGVQAARDAVLALPVIDRYDKWWSIDGPQALAAIDALRDVSND